MTKLADLVRDFRYAGRSLARSPGFTVVAVAVLALGIGATSAIFSLVSAVWLKPLPFADAERIVTLWAARARPGDGASEAVVVSEGFWFTSPRWRPRGRRPHDHTRWLPPFGRRCRAAGFSLSER